MYDAIGKPLSRSGTCHVINTELAVTSTATNAFGGLGIPGPVRMTTLGPQSESQRDRRQRNSYGVFASKFLTVKILSYCVHNVSIHVVNERLYNTCVRFPPENHASSVD